MFKRKLLSIFKNEDLYQKIIHNKANIDVLINTLYLEDLLKYKLCDGGYISAILCEKILSNFDIKLLNNFVPKRFKIRFTNDKVELKKLGHYFNENGILWASGHKFKEFVDYHDVKYFQLDCGVLTYSTEIKCSDDVKSIDEFITEFEKIKETISSNIDKIIKQ